MSTDTKAIIGIIVGIGLVVAGLLSTQIANVNASLNTRVDDVRVHLAAQIAEANANVDDLRVGVRDMRTRLRSVEISFAKVDQRLLTIERVVLPASKSSKSAKAVKG